MCIEWARRVSKVVPPQYDCKALPSDTAISGEYASDQAGLVVCAEVGRGKELSSYPREEDLLGLFLTSHLDGDLFHLAIGKIACPPHKVLAADYAAGGAVCASLCAQRALRLTATEEGAQKGTTKRQESLHAMAGLLAFAPKCCSENGDERRARLMVAEEAVACTAEVQMVAAHVPCQQCDKEPPK